jgi:hypothetical protein
MDDREKMDAKPRLESDKRRKSEHPGLRAAGSEVLHEAKNVLVKKKKRKISPFTATITANTECD